MEVGTMNEDINEIKEALLEKDFYKRILLVLSGTFILAINYNLFLLPNHFVIGGLSGIAIIVQTALGWDPTMFLYIATIILTCISLAFFGLKNTRASTIGSILYPVFITATVPLTTYLKQYAIFDNIVLTLLFAGILFGFATGIIYKAGFDTGGSDIIIHMIQKFFHFSEGNSSRIVQGMIILSGGFVFGLNQMIYALLILAIYTAVIDKITIRISDSKQFLIHTDESKKVEKFIMHELHTGITN